MDHLRNRVTHEINARINDDEAFKTNLYGGKVAARPNDYEGKEYAVRRCEDIFAVGDAVGMCRFDTQFFNSPALPGCEEFSDHLRSLTVLDFSVDDLLQIGCNITGLDSGGLPKMKWRKQLLENTTGFAISVTLPAEWKFK